MRISNTVQDVIQALLLEIRSAIARFLKDNFSFLRDPSEALSEEIKVMLGRGEISQEQYEHLNQKLRYSSLGRGDLEVLRRKARRRAQQQGVESSLAQETAVADGLDRLYIRIASLEDARREARHALLLLQEDLKRVRDFASAAETMARKTLPDENEARALLEIRQNMLERLQALEARKRSLEQSTRRLEVMQGELYAREAELRALGAQAGLAKNEYWGWEHLLSQEQSGMPESYGQPEDELNIRSK